MINNRWIYLLGIMLSWYPFFCTGPSINNYLDLVIVVMMTTVFACLWPLVWLAIVLFHVGEYLRNIPIS